MTLTLTRCFPADLQSFQEPDKAGTATVPMIPTKTLRLREVKELIVGLPASGCQLGCEARCVQQHQVPCECGGLLSGSSGCRLAGPPGAGGGARHGVRMVAAASLSGAAFRCPRRGAGGTAGLG